MNSEKSSGGIWMLVGLVALLTAPMIAGHYIGSASASDVPAAAASAQ